MTIDSHNPSPIIGRVLVVEYYTNTCIWRFIADWFIQFELKNFSLSQKILIDIIHFMCILSTRRRWSQLHYTEFPKGKKKLFYSYVLHLTQEHALETHIMNVENGIIFHGEMIFQPSLIIITWFVFEARASYIIQSIVNFHDSLSRNKMNFTPNRATRIKKGRDKSTTRKHRGNFRYGSTTPAHPSHRTIWL